MKAKIFIIMAIVGLSLLFINVQKTKSLVCNQLLMANIDALTDPESGKGAAEKIETDRSEGPYADEYGQTYYILHHSVDCYDIGEIKCNPTYSFKIVY